MGLQLYPHNQTAYLAALKMMEAHGKAAVIHPTGTGKSFLAFQLALEHPKDLILWLAPSEYIYRTQLRGLASAMPRLAPGGPSNILFLTYAKLMRAEGGMDALCPDWIVLDEFHRAGSPQWGRGVKRLMDMNPNAKVLGLTATSVRYLDSQRDMANELFLGHVASEMTLGEAIARGILPAPKYVTALYSYQKEWDRLKDRAKKAVGKASFQMEEALLEDLKRALEDADGLDRIFERHIESRHGRYLVFCSGKEHMAEMMGKVREWLFRVDPEPRLYSVAYDDPDSEEAYAKFQEDSSSHLKLLFSIDMLNEGIHLDGVDGVILLRPTVSPILYLQQIGRALAAGRRSRPIIFDIVDNFDALRSIDGILEDAESYFLRTPGSEHERERFHGAFQVFDEAKDCREIFKGIGRKLSLGWEGHYQEAKAFYQDNGHLRIPKTYVTPSGISLGAWLATQRKAYQGKAPGRLTTEQAERLTLIGMDWGSGSDRGFERGLAALEAYVKAHGDADVPTGYVTKDGFSLGKWVSNIRQRKKGASGKALTERQAMLLDQIGMIWDRASCQWERNYEKANAYFLAHGDLDVPRGYMTEDGTALGVWLENQRSAYAGTKKGAARLSEEQARRLEGIGMEWGMRQDKKWEERYRLAKRYYNAFGDLKIPSSYVTEDGCLLGRWLMRQREQSRKHTLRAERRELLRRIGFEGEMETQKT